MSRLQGRAKPVIERLWFQNAYTFNIEDSRTLSLWTVMTAMVMQTLGETDTHLFTELERTLFWKREQIPQMIGIWVANCPGHPSTYSQSRSMWTGPSRGAEWQARGNVITMAFGSLAIQILKVALNREVASGTEVTVSQNPGPWEEVARRIWPIQPDSVRWPPASGLRSEADLDLFAERFCPQNPATG
jgi:hypothetical protein